MVYPPFSRSNRKDIPAHKALHCHSVILLINIGDAAQTVSEADGLTGYAETTTYQLLLLTDEDKPSHDAVILGNATLVSTVSTLNVC